jgi:hypothetical protein
MAEPGKSEVAGPSAHAAQDSTVTTASLDSKDVEAGSTQTMPLWKYLMADIDTNYSTAPLAAYCFMTGYMYV